MIEFQNTVPEDEDFDTILSDDIDFTGTITFEKSFLVRGRVRGEINATGILLIDENAIVEANIRADVVIVRGTVTGDIVAGKSLEITASGTLKGDINTPQVHLHAGCLFNGRCGMERI
ncbi:MAG: polymer-forming cytoskeletal protein [Spirochaetaceae bacterium]|jgi:cytoskeletal protein CcmA (bactofilin family)|nr:polymer-forming cytoskeletal protein [Spirochaetaceae bacterium]